MARGSNSASYLARRLLRDAPDVFQALERGEYRSVRAAGIAAGIVRVPTTLERAKAAIDRLTDAEWQEVRAWADSGRRTRP